MKEIRQKHFLYKHWFIQLRSRLADFPENISKHFYSTMRYRDDEKKGTSITHTHSFPSHEHALKHFLFEDLM